MTPYEQTMKIIDSADMDKLRLIVKKLKTSDKVSEEERGKIRSAVEVRRNYLAFDLFDDYLDDETKIIPAPVPVLIKESKPSNPIVGSRHREDKSRVRVDETPVRQAGFSDLHQGDETEVA